MEEKLDKIISLLEELVHNSKHYNGYAKWSYEQEEFLDVMFTAGHDVPELIKLIKEKFGIDRSAGAICSRISKLGLNKPIEKKPAFKKKEPTSVEPTTIGYIFDLLPWEVE